MPLLQIRGLRKSFGGVTAVADVSLEIEAGQIHSIIGPNGAGKTTLFNLISGYYASDSGKVFFRGEDITGLPPQEIVKRGMGRSFQVTKIFPKLTVYENLQVPVLFRRGKGSNLLESSRHLFKEETEEILGMVDLGSRAPELAGTLAAGDRKRLELGIVLALQPALLLLDEPTCGMSPVETARTIDLIQEITARKALTVLFTEHKMDLVFRIASRITVMNFGEIVAAGAPEEIRRNPKVQQIYFGEERCSSR
jgi:branched-chain amino acid transport system ATP-binding protein